MPNGVVVARMGMNSSSSSISCQGFKSAPELESVRNELTLEIQKAAVDARVDELIKKATIERPDRSSIDPEVMRDLGALEN